MRTFILLLVTLLLTLPAPAQIVPGGLQSAIERAARQAAQEGRKPVPPVSPFVSTRKEKAQIIQALSKEMALPKGRPLNWQDVQKKSQVLQQEQLKQNTENAESAIEAFDTDRKSFIFQQSLPRYGYARPDYAFETKDVKYIYVSDASAHGTQTIPAEVIQVLRSVRRARPHARVLLAAEFFVRTEPGVLPLFFHDVLPNDNTEPFEIQAYGEVWLEAFLLNMDILGLDDLIYSNDNIKVGDSWVAAKSIPQKMFSQLGYPDAAPGSSLFNIIACNILYTTEWGVQQRNEQWVRYIQALSPYYDVIITYAGDGHLTIEYIGNVPELMGQPFVLFNFYTEEQLPQEEQEFYKKQREINVEEGVEMENPHEMEEGTASKLGKIADFLVKDEQKQKVTSLIDFTSTGSLERMSHSPVRYVKYIERRNTMFDVYLPDNTSSNAQPDGVPPLRD